MRIFLSYCWADRNIAEVIDNHFSKKKYSVLRDIRDIGYKENIKDYMRKIRDTDYAILIVSDSFLKSANCMFEVLELVESPEYEKRVIPVLVDGIKIFRVEDRLKYFDFWKRRLSDLKALAQEKGTDYNGGDIENEIADCRRIIGSLDDFLLHLCTHLHPSFRKFQNENFKSIELYLDPLKSKVVSKTHLFGHPIGLFILSLMSFWDRFSYYGLRSILVLVLLLPVADGGLGLVDYEAFAIYSTFTAGMYLLNIVGGFVGDLVLNRKRTQLLGMFIMTIGFFFMSQSSVFMYIGLTIIAVGSGLMKPNSIALISELYHDQDYLRDDGFSIFYTLISSSALISVLLISFIFDKYGHETGFLVAGLGMLLSLGVYLIGIKHISGGMSSPIGMDKNIELSSNVRFKSFKMLGVALLVMTLFWLPYDLLYSLVDYQQLSNTDNNSLYYNVLYGVLILMFGIPLSYVIGRRIRKVSHGLYLSKLAVGIILSLMATTILLWGWRYSGLALLIVFSAVSTLSELFFQPTMIAYVTWIAPKKFLATSVSFLLLSFFLTFQLSGLLFNWFDIRSSNIIIVSYTIQIFLLIVVTYVLWRGRNQNWELFNIK